MPPEERFSQAKYTAENADRYMVRKSGIAMIRNIEKPYGNATASLRIKPDARRRI